MQWSELQWLLAALGVGIGFGLQEIISNLVSGLIILFERPIKVGDQVELDNTIGTVIAVTMRSTSVQTFQNHILIVPNKDIITGKVVNRTGADPRVRLELAIGVAYGSDLKLVSEVLLEVTRNDGRVMRRPPPNVLFMGHGQSSLDFELRAWTQIDVRQQVLSDLRLALDAAFRRKGIEIPFPQHDVHIIDSADSAPLPAAQPRSVDGVAASDGTSGVLTDGAPAPSPK